MLEGEPKKNLARVKDWYSIQKIADLYDFQLLRKPHWTERKSYALYEIEVSGKRIATMVVEDQDNGICLIHNTNFDRNMEHFKGRGFGTLMYILLARDLAKYGKSLQSAGPRTNDAEALWKRLVSKGLAEEIPGYAYVRYGIRKQIFEVIPV